MVSGCPISLADSFSLTGRARDVWSREGYLNQCLREARLESKSSPAILICLPHVQLGRSPTLCTVWVFPPFARLFILSSCPPYMHELPQSVGKNARYADTIRKQIRFTDFARRHLLHELELAASS